MDDAVAWAADQVGSGVTHRRALTGGLTSTMLALAHDDGRESVLRLIDREPWRAHGAALATREHHTQLELAGTGVPAPRSLALDADGVAAGVAAHLMTRLPGSPDETRVDDAALQAQVRLLARIHAVEPVRPPREYQSWAWEAKYVVPAWAERAEVWESAFELLRSAPPPYEPTFLHRDFQPRNLLWTGEILTGIVDWVETSTGPAWLDVAHAATNIALRHGSERADAFAAAYTSATGRIGDPYWEVMDAVGFLPPPGRTPMFAEPAQLRRWERYLADRLR